MTTTDLTDEIKRVATKIAGKEKLTETEIKFAKNCLLKYAESRDNRAAGRAGKLANDDEYHRLHREKTLSDRIEKEFKTLREELI